MSFTVYKLIFKAPVHFGNGRLVTCNTVFYADTLFSALCKEALKLYGREGIERLFGYAQKGELLFSDAMPYTGDTLLVPKPVMRINNTQKKSDSTLKKTFKKLKYIPVDDLDLFISGNYDPAPAVEISEGLGKLTLRAGAAIHDNDDSEPFSVRNFTFAHGCGLYFIARAADEDVQILLDELMDSLSYSGIGGRLSAGLGRFEYTYEDPSDALLKRLDGEFGNYMSLSVAMSDMTDEDALSQILSHASFEIIKRSGFIASESFSDTPRKKQDMYFFKGGSCFQKRFDGAIFNAAENGAHPVYRYAKPLFIGI